MKKKVQIVVFFVALLALFGVMSCGNGSDDEESTNSSNGSTAISLDDTSVGSNVDFTGLSYSDVASDINLYTKTDSTYTKVDSFAKSMSREEYWLGAGGQKIGNAFVWQKTVSGKPTNIFRVLVYPNGTKTASYGLGIIGSSVETNLTADSTIDISKLNAYIVIKAPSAGTVTAKLINNASSKVTTTNEVAAFVDADGKVIAAQSIDNRSEKQEDETSNIRYYTLTAEVSKAGYVYLVFTRNGEDGGGLNVQSMYYGAADDIGSGETFVGLSYDKVANADWYTLSSEKDNTVLNDYIYTKANEFTQSEETVRYYLGTCGQKIGNAFVWQPINKNRPKGIVFVRVDADATVVSNRGLEFDSQTYNSSATNTLTENTTVNIKNLTAYVVVNATGEGIVTAKLQSSPGSKVTTTNAVAALVDAQGKVLAIQSIDNRKAYQEGELTNIRNYTLTANVTEPGYVYLIFARNGDGAADGSGGGGLHIQSIMFQPNVHSYKLTYQSEYTTVQSKATTGQTLTTTDVSPQNYPGYMFEGWYYDSGYARQARVGDTISKDTTLYAKWRSWEDFFEDVSVGTRATFANVAYTDVSALDWYTKGETKDTAIGDYPYTKVSTFDVYTKYWLGTGGWKIDNAVVWQKHIATRPVNLFLVWGIPKDEMMPAKISSSGLRFTEDAYASSATNKLTANSTVDIKNLNAYVVIKATAAGTVEAELQNSESDKCTTTNAVAALVDARGKVLAVQSIDNRKEYQKGEASYNRTYSLTADVTEAGYVYLVFCRNGDADGGLKVKSISYTATE